MFVLLKYLPAQQICLQVPSVLLGRPQRGFVPALKFLCELPWPLPVFTEAGGTLAIPSPGSLFSRAESSPSAGLLPCPNFEVWTPFLGVCVWWEGVGFSPEALMGELRVTVWGARLISGQISASALLTHYTCNLPAHSQTRLGLQELKKKFFKRYWAQMGVS